MLIWNDIHKEIEETTGETKYPQDKVRHCRLREFSERTGRNVLTNYSGWLQSPDPDYYDAVSI